MLVDEGLALAATTPYFILIIYEGRRPLRTTVFTAEPLIITGVEERQSVGILGNWNLRKMVLLNKARPYFLVDRVIGIIGLAWGRGLILVCRILLSMFRKKAIP